MHFASPDVRRLNLEVDLLATNLLAVSNHVGTRQYLWYT